MYDTAYHGPTLVERRILITGGAGFIGSNLVAYLLKHGVKKVRVLDNLISGSLENINSFRSDPRFEFIKGDIRELSDCMAACSGMDLVCHQAALGSVPRSVKEPHLTTSHNISGFVNMVVAARDNGIKRFVYASSSSVYGDHTTLPKVEDTIGIPLSPYAITKYNNEVFAHNFASLYDMQFIGLRYFNVFGPNQSPDGAYAAVIPLFAKACLTNQDIIIHGDGLQTRDFTFVENVVQVNIKALLTENTNALNKVYNVGCGGRYSILQLAQGIIEYMDSPNTKIVHQAPREGDIRDSQASIQLAKKLLHYDPQFDFWKGLQLTVAYFKEKLT